MLRRRRARTRTCSARFSSVCKRRAARRRNVRGAFECGVDLTGKRVIVVFLANHPNAAATKAAQDALLVCAWERSC